MFKLLGDAINKCAVPEPCCC